MIVVFPKIIYNGRPVQWKVDVRANTAHLVISAEEPFDKSIQTIMLNAFEKQGITGLSISSGNLVIEKYREFCIAHKSQIVSQSHTGVLVTFFEGSSSSTSSTTTRSDQAPPFPPRSRSHTGTPRWATPTRPRIPISHSYPDIGSPPRTRADEIKVTIPETPLRRVLNILSFDQLTKSNRGATWVYKKELLDKNKYSIDSISQLQLVTPNKLSALISAKSSMPILVQQQKIAKTLESLLKNFICQACIDFSDEKLQDLAPIFSLQIVTALNLDYGNQPLALSGLDSERIRELSIYNPSAEEEIIRLQKEQQQILSTLMIKGLFLDPDKSAIAANPTLELLCNIRDVLEEKELLDKYLQTVNELQNLIIELTNFCPEINPEIKTNLQLISSSRPVDEYVPLKSLIKKALENSSKTKSTDEIFDEICQKLFIKRDTLDSEKCYIHSAEETEYFIKKNTVFHSKLMALVKTLSQSKHTKSKTILKEFIKIVEDELKTGIMEPASTIKLKG